MSARPPASEAPSYGVVFPATSVPEDLTAFVQAMEGMGYDEVWVVEDCFLSGGLILAATALAVTKRLRVGIGLLPASIRNPALAAMEIATLARMHPGRLTVAFGHGVEVWMRQIGARPANRITALSEVVSCVRRLLAGETVTMAGSWAQLDAVAIDRPPHVQPKILVGTTGARGIRVAAEQADGVLLPEGSSPRFIAETAGRLRAVSPVRDVGPTLATYVWLAAGATPSRRDALQAAFDAWLKLDLYPAPRTALGASATTGALGHGAAVLAELAITGRPDEAAAAARRVLAAGSDRLILTAPDDGLEQYRWFAEEVLPLART